ncbi:MAG TPA: beta-1,6-N-acetylglucosaminyltransferase [Opitutus sp.]|nr:beta-1,6-N-acetylglucosaminyltransferase [Opitutus sp.]
MPLAILILAHKNPRQVARLFEVIHRPEDLIVLHFDRRAPRALHRLGRDLARRHPNVILLRPRVVLWGGYRMVGIQLEAIAAALRSPVAWTHFINLTGQDFPLRPIDEIATYLAARPAASFVSWFDPVFVSVWRDAHDRLARYYIEWPWLDRLLRVRGLGRHLRRLLRWENDLPHLTGYSRTWPDFHYYGGANHVILSRAAGKYVCTSPAARAIARWLRHSSHANEILFQTALLNSPLAPTIVNTHLREIDFPPHAAHPRTFTTADLERLARSPHFFARKFDETVDARVLDALTRRLPPRAGHRRDLAHL